MSATEPDPAVQGENLVPPAPTAEPTVDAADIDDAPRAEPGPSQSEPEGDGTDVDLVKAMDRVSLDQALQSFAVANARVIDLTARLTSLVDQVARLNDENAQLRIQAARLQDLEESTTYQAVRASRAGATMLRRAFGRLRRR